VSHRINKNKNIKFVLWLKKKKKKKKKKTLHHPW
jgi:hypothetical protein